MTQDKTFMEQEIIKLDKIITKVGGGYIDDDNSADYGKFVASLNGTYQFNANFFNHNKNIGADLIKNGVFITGANNGGSVPASLSAILDLQQGDEVYLVRPGWVPSNAEYGRYFASFSGTLLDLKV